MKLVSLVKNFRGLATALFTAATLLSLPNLCQAQNSIYSISKTTVPTPTNGGRMMFRLVNGTGGTYADNQIYWGILGINPANGQWSYLDSTGTLRPISNALNDASGHLVKNGVNYANIYYTVSQAQWISMPSLISARIFVSVGSPCYIKTFDTGFAGPNIDNPSDPNRNIYFDFAEFTLDATGYHGNTTRVDAFGFPLQMRLFNNAGNYDRVVGEKESETRDGIFAAYRNEVPLPFKDLADLQTPYRIVAPIHGSFAAGGANANYFASYNSQYTTQEILIANGRLAQQPDLNAAINRHVYTLAQSQWGVVSNYYKAAPANYFAAFWHPHSIDGLAYGMPYDDVNGQASYLEVGDPKALILRVGWNTPVGSGTGTGGNTGTYAGTPYTGTPAAIPGAIYFANYDKGGEGVAFHDSEATNQGGQYRTTEGVDIERTTDPGGPGYNVGWTAAGEWMKYTVNVATTKTYTIGFRVATPTGGGIFHLEDENGNRVTANITVPTTGGWQNWQTITTTANLTAGKHVLKFVQDSGGYNINFMAF